MNGVILERLEQKIRETVSNKDEILQLARSLSEADGSRSFVLGMVMGRLYNAFYYQSRRVLGREPTKEEFEEFLVFVRGRRQQLEGLW